ncbi:MAG TPA: selenide, water dikinase SelD [Firmicutes bacterium]|nr:selenide, water dikinase SelD [Bacillota bacterium]
MARSHGYDPNVLVGFETSDDAGVYRLSSDLAIVQTVDFFTPIVDDPYVFGQIAAANALSDVYAMGARPVTAMNVVCFPCSAGMDMLAEIIEGGADKVREAGVALIGGHTVTDNEPKYGLSVTGLVHPARIITNSSSKPGDVLILTKPLGTGILTTAFKFDKIGEEDLAGAVRIMRTLNKAASEAMQAVGVNACTDITGFGLIGHSCEMARASGVQFLIEAHNVPVLPMASELAGRDILPGGARENMLYFQEWADVSSGVPTALRAVLFDPQTSGGLLISVPAAKAELLVSSLRQAGVEDPRIIGEVVEIEGAPAPRGGRAAPAVRVF